MSVAKWAVAVAILVGVTQPVLANMRPPPNMIWESEPRYERVKQTYSWAQFLPLPTIILPIFLLICLNKHKPRTTVLVAAINALTVFILTSCLWTTYVRFPERSMNIEFKKGSPPPRGEFMPFEYSRPPEGITAPELYVLGMGAITAVAVVGFGMLVWVQRGAIKSPAPVSGAKRQLDTQPLIDDLPLTGPTSRDPSS